MLQRVDIDSSEVLHIMSLRAFHFGHFVFDKGTLTIELIEMHTPTVSAGRSNQINTCFTFQQVLYFATL